MNSSIGTLIVTAHPDDETIFFSGPLHSRPKSSLYVICVTDGNADRQGGDRQEQFQKALSLWGVQGSTLGLPDNFGQRLDIGKIREALSQWSPKEVFTHNIQGEYGHPHHQDVSFAVHESFFSICPVYSPAYNCYPNLEFGLTEDQWRFKFEILAEIYWSETRRFQQFLPCTWREGFSQFSLEEVRLAYQALLSKKLKSTDALTVLKPYGKYLMHDLSQESKRPF